LSEVFFIIVMRRSGHRAKVEKLLRSENIPFFPQNESVPQPPAAFLHTYVSDYLELSATTIRNKMSHGQDISPYVEKNVQQIMEEIKLYEEG
jgi:nicotinic acid mononucleotide adenylyltransferase